MTEMQHQQTNQLNKRVEPTKARRRSGMVLQDNRDLSAPLQRKNTGLPDNLKSGMENLSGMNLDNVRVHYNSSQPETVQAHAFAQGSNIHLAPGQENHLPHELGHVVQQAQGRVKATTNVGGVAVNNDHSLESEADRMGTMALQMCSQMSGGPGARLKAPLPQLPSDTAMQRFSNGELQHRAEQDQVGIEAARLALVMAEQDLGQEAAQLLIAQAMELRDTYSAGNVVGKAGLQTMQAVLTDEEMQQAAAAYSVQHPDDEALVEDLPVNGGNRNWASGPMNDALDAVRAQLQQFTTGHHKVSKSRLASVLALMTPEQQTRAKTELDLPPGSGLNAFKSLGANLSTGPNSGLRIDEHGQALDGNRFEDGSSTPRTHILEQVDELVTQIRQTREQDPATPLTELEFTTLLGMLVQAEKYHYLKTDGELLDAETTMWQELPQGNQQASLWRRKPVSQDAYPGMPEQFHDSVRDMKKPKYRSPQDKVYNHVPAVHQGDSYFDYSFGGIKYRPKYTYISQGPDTAENIKTWAKAGYKAADGDGSVSLTRVMPVDLLAAFRTGVMNMGLPDHSQQLRRFIHIMVEITRLKLGQGEYQGKTANFELIRDQVLEELEEIRQRIEEYEPEILLNSFEQGKAMALRALEIERLFVSGQSQESGEELANMFQQLPLWQQ